MGARPAKSNETDISQMAGETCRPTGKFGLIRVVGKHPGCSSQGLIELCKETPNISAQS